MNRYVLAALLCSNFFNSAQAQLPVAAEQRVLVGAYSPAPLDLPLVQETKAYVQKHLAAMTLGELREAYTQVVAGVNIKVVCNVTADDGNSTWEFVVYQSLDGKRHLYSANRI